MAWGFWFYHLKWEILVYGTALITAVVFGWVFGTLPNTLTATVVFLLSFNVFEMYLPFCYHVEKHDPITNVKKCVKLTTACFCVGAILLSTFPFQITISMGIVLGLLLDYVRYRIEKGIREERDLRKELDLLKNNLNNKSFNCDNCTERELEMRVREVYGHLEDDDLDYKITRAKRHFIEEARHKKIDANPRASEQERRRLRKKLNK